MPTSDISEKGLESLIVAALTGLSVETVENQAVVKDLEIIKNIEFLEDLDTLQELVTVLDRDESI